MQDDLLNEIIRNQERILERERAKEKINNDLLVRDFEKLSQCAERIQSGKATWRETPRCYLLAALHPQMYDAMTRYYKDQKDKDRE